MTSTERIAPESSGTSRLRREVVVVVALAVLGPSLRAEAGGFPPIAQASVDRAEPIVGEPVRFSSAGSFDPDEGPAALAFAWSFGDGESSTESAPVHAFSAPGAYHVTVSVSDGESSTEAGVTVFVLAPPTSPGPASSSPIALLEDPGELWVANRDAASVTILEPAELRVREEIHVGEEPVAIAGTRDGVLVACAGDGTVVRIDRTTRSLVASRRIATRVAGMVVVDADRLLVALPSDGAVVMLATSDLRELSRMPVRGDPRALAIDSARRYAYTASFLSAGGTAQIARLDLETQAVDTIALADDPGPDTPSSARGTPNLLGAIAVEPAGDLLWVGGLESNVARGLYRDGQALTDDTRTRGIMTPVALPSGAEVLERRIDTNDADAVSAIAFSPGGRFAYVAHPGIGAVSTYDLPSLRLFSSGRGATVPFRSRIEIGDLPDGIVVSRDGTRAYVRASLSRRVVALDLGDPAAPVILQAAEVVREILDPEIALGRILFHRSRAPIHSRSGYVACASCHPDGGHDGMTWDFTHSGEGLRNTIDLRGRGGTATGPLHWSGNFDEVQDFENDIVHQLGGTGLAADGAPPSPPLGAPNAGRSAELDALAAYVGSLTEGPPSPRRRPDGSHSEAAIRGRAAFARAGCATCHAPPLFTDSSLEPPFVRHDVGTLAPWSGTRLGEPLDGLDTPSLIGAWASAPYFHDGSAATLEDVVSRNVDDRHGLTSTLTAAERADLVAYLLEIDGPEPGPAAPGGCGCRSADGSRAAAPIFLIATSAALLRARLRRRSRVSVPARSRDGIARDRTRRREH